MAGHLSEFADFVVFIDKIDDLFRKLIAGEFRGDPISATLFMNAHASFLAAVRIAFSAQTPPTHMVLRGALESALYGLIASRSEENRAVWLNRDKDRGRCKKLYTARKAIDFLKDDPGLFDLLGEAYELGIDFGAHPNVRSVVENIGFEETDQGHLVSLTYLHAARSNQAARAIAACIEVGLCIIFISPHAFPKDVKAQEAHAEAGEIRKEFDQFIRDQGYYDDPDCGASELS